MADLPRSFVALPVLAMLLAATGGETRAHGTQSGQLRFEHPWSSTGVKGGEARLFVFIENEEPQAISLLQAGTPVAERVELRFADGTGGVGVLQSRSIRSGESLNVASHHMWFSLLGLRRDLSAGERFVFDLEISDGRRVPLDVVVAERSAP